MLEEILIGWWCHYDTEDGDYLKGDTIYLPRGEDPVGKENHWKMLLEKCCKDGEWKVAQRMVRLE